VCLKKLNERDGVNMNLKDEHKAEITNKAFFEEGIHEVKILLVELATTNDDKEYIEFTVTNDEGTQEGTARFWFTTDKAALYSFNSIRSIFVHNVPEEKKQATRDKVNAILTTEQLAKACLNLIGQQCWYQVSRSSRTYVTATGETRYSLDKDIYGYKPSPKPLTNIEAILANDDTINASNVDKIFGL
jgi:hypothetical protein